MGDESLILREDGFIRLNFPVTSLTYHSNLNKILVKNELGLVYVLDVNSGALLQATSLSADEGGVRGVEYVPGADRVFVWDGAGVGARTDYNGVLLLHTALQRPLPSSQPEKPITIEIVLSEAILLYQCLQSLDVLAIEGLSDFLNELKEAIEDEPLQKGFKVQKWCWVTFSLPQTVLRLVTSGIVQELKSQNRRIPALAIASAIGHRANELMPCNREEESRALMYSEAERKETFKRWPHMDYKWALPARMAQAGFYHQPTPSGDDRAMCFTCMVCLVCWEKSDEPWVEHERHSPNCPFVRGEYTHNVPISVSNATACAVPCPNVTVVSKGNTGELIATGTSEGKVNIWRFDCGLKLAKYVLLSPYDSIFSGILATDCNKVWSASLEKDTSTYSLELTAMAFLGLTSQQEVYPQAPVELSDKDPNKTRPSLVCAVTITRTPLTTDQPIREDDASKALFDSGDKTKGSVQAMNVENEAKSNLGSNKMLFLLTYDIESGGGGGGTSGRGPGKKAAPRSDDANIYDEIYLQYSDEDGDLPHCAKTLLDDQVSNVINLNASSSKDDAKPWEPKQILITKHYKVLPPPPPTALLPELHDASQGGMLEFVDKISQLKSWKSGNLDSVGTKLADQTDAAVLQQADPITHYLNMTGQLEISGLKWYEGGDGTEKVKVTTFGGGKSTAQAQADAFEDATSDDAVSQCPAVQCLKLPLDLQLSENSKVTHLLPTDDADHLLVIVSGLDLGTTAARRDAQKGFMDSDGDVSMDVDEAPLGSSDVPAYLLLYRTNSKSSAYTLEDEPVVIRTLEPGESPVDASIVGRGKGGRAALATVGVDGSLRLYSLPDLTMSAEKQPNKGHFAALAHCGAVERLAAATVSGTLYFYALNDADADSANDAEDELTTLDTLDAGSPPRPLGVRGALDLSDLRALIAASGAHGGGATVPYTAVVPGFWCELSPARADPPHTRAWRLQNTSSTWDEHVLELTAAGGAPDRLLLHYTLHAPAAPPRRLPRVHVTLLRQSLRAGAYRAPPAAEEPAPLPPTSSADADEFLAAHGAEVLAGPVPLSTGLDLTRQAGTLVLTSPRLYRARAHTFLLHIKTLFDPAKEAAETSTDVPDATAKKGGFIGCDWLHQISITLRASPAGDSAETARQQRIAMLESDWFLDELLSAATRGGGERRTLSLDLALWVTSVRLARLRLRAPAAAAAAADATQLECVRIVEKHIDALIKNCILCSSRSVAKKCIKIILVTSEGAKNLSKPWKSTFEATLTSCVSSCLPLLGACESPGAMRWLVALAQHATGRGAVTEVVTRCLSLLEKTAKCLTERENHYHNLLRARFGLYGLPLERTIFDVEGPVLGKSTATPVTYASLLSGDAAASPPATPKPDSRLRDLLHMAAQLDGKSPPSSLAWWAQSTGVGVFSSGLSEATPLHVACHVASDGTKLESVGTRVTAAVVSALPGDPSQFWSSLKESHSKQTSQDPDSLDDAENSSLMDCDPQDKLEFNEDKFLQDDDECDIPWEQFVTRPPQHTLVVERMHSGARRFIVLDFGHVVRLTDIIIPSCSDLVTLCIDIWVQGEERDCVKLAFATDIATKHLVFTDIQPPPRARYMKITTIGRYGMSAMKCRIPLGWFYGELDEVANVPASVSSLRALHEDLACRFRLATGKLMDLLNPYLELYSGNAAHMMAYLNVTNEADPKVIAAYTECIELQQQVHTCVNVLRKLQNKTDCNEQMLELINKGRVNTDVLLERASTDKLRVMMENVVDMLLYFYFQVGDVSTPEPSRAWCTAVTGSLAAHGGAAAAALATLAARLCGAAPWWGPHLADMLADAFAPYDAPPVPLDRVLILVMYMSRKSLLSHGSNGGGVAEALAARCLELVRAPRQQPALCAAVLCALAAALDHVANLTLSHSRWEWVSGGRSAATAPSEGSAAPRSDCRMHRRKLHKKLLHQMQELEARRGIQVALEERQRARFGLKAHMAMLGKRGGGGGSGGGAGAGPEGGGGGAQPPRLVSPALAKDLAQALVDFMLLMDGSVAADTMLLCAKVVGRLCALCGGAALLDARCVLGLARLAVTLPPWPRHALTTLLQDLVEFESGESSSTPDSPEWGAGAGWAPDARVRVFGKSLAPQRKYKSASVADVLADSFGLSKSSSNYSKPKIVAITDSIKNSTSTADYQLPLVAESDDSESEEKLEQYFVEAAKKESKPKPPIDTSSSNISSCMDARLESGAEGGSEGAARRLLLAGGGALAAAVRAPAPAPPRRLTDTPAATVPRQGPPLAHTLYDVFRHLATEFQNQSDCTFMEHVVSLWLTLNGSVWSEGGWASGVCSVGGSGPGAGGDTPRVRLASDTVRALLHSLCTLETVSLRCWVLCMQALSWISSLPLQTEGSTQTMGRVILESEHFIPAIVKFVTMDIHTDGAVFSSEPYLGGVSIGAGAGAASALSSVLARVVAGRGQAGALAALRCVLGVWSGPKPGSAHDLHAALLRHAHPLLAALSDRHAPLAVRLIDTVSHLVCSWVSECNYGRLAEGGEARLAGFLADVLAGGAGPRRAPLRRSVLAQLLHYCRRLAALAVTSPAAHQQQQTTAAAAAAAAGASPPSAEGSEGAESGGQTDESKARAGTNLEDERKQRPRPPTVADAVLQHPTIMHKFYKALSMCHGMNPLCLNTSSTTEAPAGAGAVGAQAAGEQLYSTLKEDVFWLVAQIADSASDPTLVCATIIDFLRKDGLVGLSAPLQQFIVRVLDKPAALGALADAGAVQLFADRMNRCHQSAPSSHQGLVSSLMNHLKVPPQLVNMSSSKKSQQSLAENSNGLINFAPLCSVVCGNPTAQAADVLLGDGSGGGAGSCAARRVRAAAWSYHFFSADDASLALTLTLPYAVQLHEIHLQPHLTSLATCPGAVGVEAGCGGALAALGPPQNTAGMTFIRLVVSRPIVCTTVQIRLYKPRDSSNMGLLQLRLLGAPAFNKLQTGTMNNNWAGVVAACTRGALPGAAWAAVTSPASVATLSTLLAAGGAGGAAAHRALLAAAAAVPAARAPLVHALLACDGEAHAHAFQGGRGSSGDAARSEGGCGALWALVAAVCTAGGDEAARALLGWLPAAAARTPPQPAAPAAPAAAVQVAAAVLWTLKEEKIIDNVEQLITDDLFELVYNWTNSVPEASLLKKSLDSLLCSMCYIRPELFRRLLELTDVNLDPSIISMEALTDDSKTRPSPPTGAQRPAWHAARLQSLAAAAASPACAGALLASPLPRAAADTIREFSEARLRPAARPDADELMDDECDAPGDGATEEVAPMKTVLALVEWLAAWSAARGARDWLGGAGAGFWRPLLQLLCRPGRVHDTWQESTEYAQLEESTIRLFTELTACHARNQKLFAVTLHDIVESLNCTGPEGISGFTRALILRLLLSSERCRVGLRWAGGTAAGAGAWAGGPPRHPAAHAHHVVTLPTHTTVAQICRHHAPPMPYADEGGKSHGGGGGGASAGGGGAPALVYRRASDTALASAAEAWELSLAAACASKDKRVKDVKNTSLKQQGGKKKGRGETPNDASNDDLVDAALRVQLAGREGYVPPSATLGQLAAAAPQGSSPYLTLILHLDAASEAPSSWSPVDSGGGGSLLREFGACGGLALVAARLPRPRAAPAPPPRPATTHHDLDWVKLDDQYEEAVDASGAAVAGGMSGAGGNSSATSEDGGYSAVPAHALPALALLLKLKGFAAALLDEGPRAVQLLRLLLGAARDEDGRNIVVSSSAAAGSGSPSLGTLPFVVLSRLLERAPLRSAEGASLRRALLHVGAVRLVLACLAVFTHHHPAKDSQASNGSSGKAEEKSQLYWAKGTGFGTGSTQQSWNVEQALVRQRTEEHHVTALLQVIASYMNPGEKWPPEEETPAEEEEESEGLKEARGAEEASGEPELPAEFLEMVAASSLVPALCSYLRNDSVLDMSRHIPLYVCVLRCARAVHGAGPGAGGVAARALPRLLQQMSRTTNSYATKLRMSKKNLFGKMTYSQRFSSSSNSELSEEDEGLATLIADIQATAALMCRAGEDEPHGPAPRALSGASREARYIEVMRRLQFETFEMITECAENGYRFTVPYHFESTVRAAGERSHPQRMKRLAQEAATLATSLPLSHCSSVFVRTDADRLDVMKVLITGPSDTPYANGCFVLDVYFPAEYPAVPMLINLETTGRHSVRFNPNLYNDGKVCLSVLNTWHGRPEEKWNAHTSSFLQVLVSIQSLILVPEPYFNEPGYERSRGTRVGSAASLEYNSNIYQACVRWAMLDHLRNPEPCFKEVIQTHFWMKRNEIMSTVAGWISELEARPGDERTQRTIQLNLLALKRHYVKLQEELGKLPVPAGLEDMDEPFTLPAAPPPPPPPPPAPAPAPEPVSSVAAVPTPLFNIASADAGDLDHDMEKIVSQVLD